MTEVWRAPVAFREATLDDLAVEPRRMLLLGSGPAATSAAVRARRTGCQVTLCTPTDPRPDPSAIGPLLDLLDDSDVVGLLRGAEQLLDHPAFDPRPCRPGQVWVATGDPGAPTPAPVHLVVLTEPASPSSRSLEAPSGYLAWLIARARSTAAPGGTVTMWLQSGGFLLLEPDRTTVVPGTFERPIDPPTPESVTAVVAAMLDADLDVVGALEAATRELSGPQRSTGAQPPCSEIEVAAG